eukprot:5897319-Pyramimonas_sp.AAC.1
MAELSDGDREPDPTVFALSGAQPVATDAIHVSIAEWLAAAELGTQLCHVQGKGPNRRFIHQTSGCFKMAIPLAVAAAVARALQLLARGGHRRFAVQAPPSC